MGFTFFSKQGYFVDIAKSAPWTHSLGGANRTIGAECQACKRPLLLMLTLDTRDPRLGLSFPHGRTHLDIDDGGNPQVEKLLDLPLFYCWSCGFPLTYRLNPCGGVDILDRSSLTAEGSDNFPYRNYPRAFPPRRVRLVPIRPFVQKLIHRANARTLSPEIQHAPKWKQLFVPRHQVGGEPFLVQGTRRDAFQDCTLCRRPITILAAVGDESGTRRGFTGNKFVQVIFHYCLECQVVIAMNECD